MKGLTRKTLAHKLAVRCQIAPALPSLLKNFDANRQHNPYSERTETIIRAIFLFGENEDSLRPGFKEHSSTNETNNPCDHTTMRC
jgi:hypothetical protein